MKWDKCNDLGDWDLFSSGKYICKKCQEKKQAKKESQRVVEEEDTKQQSDDREESSMYVYSIESTNNLSHLWFKNIHSLTNL